MKTTNPMQKRKKERKKERKIKFIAKVMCMTEREI